MSIRVQKEEKQTESGQSSVNRRTVHHVFVEEPRLITAVGLSNLGFAESLSQNLFCNFDRAFFFLLLIFYLFWRKG